MLHEKFNIFIKENFIYQNTIVRQFQFTIFSATKSTQALWATILACTSTIYFTSTLALPAYKPI